MVYLMNENAYRFLLHHGICYRIFSPFNPSIVEDFDQSDLEIGEKRIIISFRATEAYFIHYFRRAILIRITIST
jgi:hypothetical protein